MLYSISLKRLLCFILCILIVFTIFFTNIIKGKAIAPALIIGGVVIPEAVAIVGALLVAAGVTFAADAAIDATVNWFVNAADTAIRNKIADWWNDSSTKQITNVPDDIWDYTVDWTRTKFGTNEGISTADNHVIEYTLDDGRIFPITISFGLSERPYPIASIGQTFIYGEDIYTLESVGQASYPYSSDCYVYYIYLNGEKIDSYKNIFRAYPGNISFYLHGVSTGVELGVKSTYFSYGRVESDTLPIIRVEESSERYQDFLNNWENTKAVTVNNQEVMGNPAWDIPKTAEGDRVINVPRTYADIRDKTWTDIANPDMTIPDNPPNTSWDYPNWTIPADILKNKFPFSIPWDLKNAITSLKVVPQAPKWIITFPSNIFVGGGSIVIDFQMFETWAKIIRWGILIIFNIFLILATRKIIGAS